METGPTPTRDGLRLQFTDSKDGERGRIRITVSTYLQQLGWQQMAYITSFLM
jgi:hypothetical protein